MSRLQRWDFRVRARSSESLHMSYIVVHGEDFFEVTLIGEDVEHPGEKVRLEGAPFGFTGLFRVDGAEHAELRMRANVFLDSIRRGLAEINVPVPTRDADRDALVQFIFGACGLAVYIAPSNLYSNIGVRRYSRAVGLAGSK